MSSDIENNDIFAKANMIYLRYDITQSVMIYFAPQNVVEKPYKNGTHLSVVLFLTILFSVSCKPRAIGFAGKKQ